MTPSDIVWSEDAEYGFAVGRVRAIERTLLDRSVYDRLVAAESLMELSAVLNESGYIWLQSNGDGDWTVWLRRAAADNRNLLLELCRCSWASELLAIADEARRAKEQIKREFQAGISPTDLGRYQEAAEEIRAAYATSGDPSQIDHYVDRAEQALTLDAVAFSSFLTCYYGLSADLANIRSVVRLRLREGNAGQMALPLLPGGRVPDARLLAMRDCEWDQMPVQLAHDSLRALIVDGAAYARSEGSLTRLERLCREELAGFARLARYAPFGHEPVIAYFLLRENELTNLRLLYSAKALDLGREYCRELVAYAS